MRLKYLFFYCQELIEIFCSLYSLLVFWRQRVGEACPFICKVGIKLIGILPLKILLYVADSLHLVCSWLCISAYTYLELTCSCLDSG